MNEPKGLLLLMPSSTGFRLPLKHSRSVSVVKAQYYLQIYFMSLGDADLIVQMPNRLVKKVKEI